MMYSFRIEQAIRAAAVLHQGELRKGSAPYPYVTHLFSVACILADYTRDEDIIIAGLLHDSISHTGYTAEEMETDFGSTVRALVEPISHKSTHDTQAPWSERKQTYITQIAKAPETSLLVVVADTIHNLRSIVEEYQDAVPAYLADFEGTLEERLVHYQTLSNILNRRLRSEILHEFNHVFDEYRLFITHT